MSVTYSGKNARVTVKVEGGDRIAKKLTAMQVYMRANAGKAVANGVLLIHSSAVLAIQTGPKTGRIYYYGKNHNIKHQASAPGEAPATRPAAVSGGNLVNNLMFSYDPETLTGYVYVRDQCPYGKWLEFGTADGKLKKRPFLLPAFRKHRASIDKAIRDAFRSAKPK